MNKYIIAYVLLFSSLSTYGSEFVNTWTLGVASDRTYHGLTESTGEPGVWLSTEWTGDIWFTGASLGYSSPDKRIERHRPLDLVIGGEWELWPDWRLVGSTKYRRFLNSNKEWDYWEFSAQLRSASGYTFKVDYAPDYYTHDTRSTVAHVSRFFEWGSQKYVVGRAGYAAFENQMDYLFGSLAIGWRLQTTTVEASYQWHDLDESRRFRDRIQEPGLEIKISHRLR